MRIRSMLTGLTGVTGVVMALTMAGCSNAAKDVAEGAARAGASNGANAAAAPALQIIREQMAKMAAPGAPSKTPVSTQVTLTFPKGGSVLIGINGTLNNDGSFNLQLTETWSDAVVVVGGEGGGLVMDSPPVIQATVSGNPSAMTFTMTGGVTVKPFDPNKKLAGHDFLTITFNMNGTFDANGSGTIKGTASVQEPGGSVAWEGDLSVKT